MSLSQTQVSQLYVSTFGRASEGEGNTYWQKEANMAEAADAMLATSAAKSYFGDTLNDNQAFIEFIYENTLNKTLADDPDGIAYWTKQLADKTKGEVVSSMIEAISTYAPGGENYNENDEATVKAYNQFSNRVEVSNYMADTVEKAPDDYETSTSFNHDLVVTFDSATIDVSKLSVDDIAELEVEDSSGISAIYQKSWSITDTDYYDLGNNLLLEVNYDTDDGDADYYLSNYTVSGNSYNLTGLEGDKMTITIDKLAVGQTMSIVSSSEGINETEKITSVSEIEFIKDTKASLFEITDLTAEEYVESGNYHGLSDNLVLKLYPDDYNVYNISSYLDKQQEYYDNYEEWDIESDEVIQAYEKELNTDDISVEREDEIMTLIEEYIQEKLNSEYTYKVEDSDIVGIGFVKNDAIHLVYEYNDEDYTSDSGSSSDGTALEYVIFDRPSDTASWYYLGELLV